MFTTILFPEWEMHEKPRASKAPDCFADLNLDQIIDPLLRSKLNRGLDSFFYTPLEDTGTVLFRQSVMRDLENKELRTAVSAFSEALVLLWEDAEQLRNTLTAKTSYENDFLSRGQMLELTERYCTLIADFSAVSGKFAPSSEGMKGFFAYLADYAASPEFNALRRDIAALRERFDKVRYCMMIKGDTIKIRKYEGQDRLADMIEPLFERFICEGLPTYKRHFPETASARSTEAELLGMVAELFPELFGELNGFCTKYLNFENDVVMLFAREVRFYLSWLEYTDKVADEGLSFCYPELSMTADGLYDLDFYDLALASLIGGKTVPNDFELREGERMLVITGPNQGGKTTFTRSFGQVHWLASLGLRVQGSRARLLLFDRILTHFEKEEDLVNLSGKLQDDLIRLKAIMDLGTSRSIFLINEIFTSTTLADALDLSGLMMDSLKEMDCPAIIVTFLDELASRGDSVVSLVSLMKDTVSEERSFKIVRRDPDGRAHAMQIATLHHLTYEQIKRRLAN
ncbi:MAG: hypothetical protein K5855_04340 [Oscillospiraceae bacterium]|jgi:hypothetical protein|nr:hypothetical protein [Oscillospiraceae bacterium]